MERNEKGNPDNLPTVSFPLKPEGCPGSNWEDAITKSKPIPNPVERTMVELATIIYTSGSTGMPKGVMLSFHAMTVTAKECVNIWKIKSTDRYLSYLPLSHCMERYFGECVAMIAGAHVFYASSLKTFVADLNRCRPTQFVSVPRLWTKFLQGIVAKVPEKTLHFLLNIPILNFFIGRILRKQLGLDLVRVAGSGSAPIPKELLTWYKKIGLTLLEGYGMTENFGYSHMSLPKNACYGYVHRASSTD